MRVHRQTARCIVRAPRLHDFVQRALLAPLIADAPGNGEMDPERLGAIVQGFATLKEQLGDQVQILIATTKAELADICDENAVQIIDPSATLF